MIKSTTVVRNELRQRIERLELLPIQPGVAVRLIGLGTDPDASIDEYARLIELDACLSSQLLGVVNSSWGGLQRRITKVKEAVSLLGTTNVRALGASFCLAAINSSWSLDPKDARAISEASLCKAVAGRILTQVTVPERSDEAFTIGLFQDIGVGLLLATRPDEMRRILYEPGLAVKELLQAERLQFGMDHAECGKLIAVKLGLPVPYPVTIGLHHKDKELAQRLRNANLSRALYAASLFPHDARSCNMEELSILDGLIKAHFPTRWSNASVFIQEVHKQFERHTQSLDPHAAEASSLLRLIEQASRQNMQCTKELVVERAKLLAPQK